MEEEEESGHLQCWQLFWTLAHFMRYVTNCKTRKNKLHCLSPWANYTNCRLSAKLVPTFVNRGCRVVSTINSLGHIPGFLDRSRYCFFQVALQLYSRGWVNPKPDPLLLRKSCSAGNWTRNLRICSQELWPLDHIRF
jgi:hypothetical protein